MFELMRERLAMAAGLPPPPLLLLLLRGQGNNPA